MKTRYDYTAPPAKNGRLHLFFGLVAIALLSGLFPSCAPARIPLGSVTRHAAHDPRTKTVEPTTTKSVR